MGAFIAQQPNKLYCRFSAVMDCPTHWNMTGQDYIDMCVEKAIIEATHEAKETLKKYLKPFSDVIKSFVPNNMTRKEFDKFLEEVGMIRRKSGNYKTKEGEKNESCN